MIALKQKSRNTHIYIKKYLTSFVIPPRKTLFGISNPPSAVGIPTGTLIWMAWEGEK